MYVCVCVCVCVGHTQSLTKSASLKIQSALGDSGLYIICQAVALSALYQRGVDEAGVTEIDW